MSDNHTIPPIIGTGQAFVMDPDVFSVFLLILCSLSFLGVITNVINVLIFSRLRSQSTTNITLLAMAVSDFFVCFTLLTGVLMETQWLQTILFQKLKWTSNGVSVICFLSVQGFFSKVTNILTAIVTFERCLCVALPLKIKSIVTPSRTNAAVFGAYLFVAIDTIPYYYVNRLGWTFNPYLNATLFGIYFTDKYLKVNAIYLPVDSITFYFIFFLIIIVCTIILVASLKKNMKWRVTSTAATTTTTTNPDAKRVSPKEMKIVKMVTIISSIFIVCYIPASMLGFLMTFSPGLFSFQKQNIELLKLFSFFVSLLQAISSSINIFVYYFNNSNYKTAFDRVFRGKEEPEKRTMAT